MSSTEQNLERSETTSAQYVTHDWTVKVQRGELTSSLFPLNSKLQWKLDLRCLSGPNVSRSLIQLTAHLSILSGSKSVVVLYCIDIQDEKGVSLMSGFGTHTVDQRFSRLELQVIKTEHVRVNSTITVKLKLVVIKETPHVETPHSDISTDMKSLLGSREELNDVTLFVDKDKEVIKANKLLLTARSPVFRAMFQAGMKEQETNQVQVPDISPRVCREMLTYMLTDEVPNINDMAEDLWHAANKYELTNLQAQCENAIVKQLTTENAAHFLLFAEQYCGAGELRDCIMSFITKDNEVCAEVVKSDAWKKVECQPDLRYEVFCRLIEVFEYEPPTKKARTDD